MYKAIGKVLEFNPFKEDTLLKETTELKEKFKINGKFDAFKHTSSYVEYPPLTATDDSGTYIERMYEGIHLASLGGTLYIVDCKEFRQYCKYKPRFLYLGESDLKVIRADASYRYLNEEGHKFVRRMLKDWETLTKPCFASRSI